MKVGVALNMLYEHGKHDAAVVHEHLAEGDLVEPLGFNSLWALEHHFTGYAMSPAPTQTLAYFAGRTKCVQLGTAVIVLPWHDPVRVAEQIALLDIMCGGRCLFGFGRGAASTEYEGFRIPMGEARPRFAEAAQVVVKALSQEVFEHHGEFFQIPKMSIRPRPISHPERRFYASSVSPESAEIIAKLGFGMLFIMQNEWSKCREDIEKFQAMSTAAGFDPKPPIILTNISCAESRQEAQERAHRYLGRKWQSIDDHYHFSDGHLANVKGYEAYGKTAKTYAKLKDPANLKKATDFYVSIQIVGTPDDCLQQLGRLQQVTGLEHLVAEFSFGNLPHHEAETNMRLFAERCLPTLQNDPAFATPKHTAADTTAPQRAAGEGIFAPA
ncbi:MAG: LLM class flavin-dependent oxidoreductase [Reyranella sp.]|uniref:LLM class flavin-dependent oxidoreductase n=1 Tax=Reyranella sp. TaxID=1929291 RepID=UPI001AC528F2|nr:LLM class flavin-dependent oxidoreductase [Reyranella sp.]MBN9087717.1 LLM class flavin-dependent oxidoreductase [Reyranella sp.]